MARNWRTDPVARRPVVIRKLLAYLSGNTFRPFAWYRIVFGIVLLALYWNRGGSF